MKNKKRKLLKSGLERRKRAEKKRSMLPTKHYYELKGKKAEEALSMLANNTFLMDWCFPNPKLPNGKELCDLLVVFDNTAIIWQIKDVKLKEGKIKDSDFQKTINQISGAYRQLFDLNTPIKLHNPRRGTEVFDPKTIDRIYLIAGFFGDAPFSIKSMFELKGRRVHVFTRRFTEIILNELDTISDFTKYIDDKEKLHDTIRCIIVRGDEEEILGHYILNNRTFKCPNGSTPSMIYIEYGHWKDLQKRKEYKAKKEADSISYRWDHLIDIFHTVDSSEYELIAREMAKSNRFERRMLAQNFLEAHELADKKEDRIEHRRVCLSQEGITYCFLFCGDSGIDEDREYRKKRLGIFCHLARGKIQKNSKIIGIATDQHIHPNLAFDYCFIDIEEWTEEDERIMQVNMKETGMFTMMEKTLIQCSEYPKS